MLLVTNTAQVVNRESRMSCKPSFRLCYFLIVLKRHRSQWTVPVLGLIPWSHRRGLFLPFLPLFFYWMWVRMLLRKSLLIWRWFYHLKWRHSSQKCHCFLRQTPFSQVPKKSSVDMQSFLPGEGPSHVWHEKDRYLTASRKSSGPNASGIEHLLFLNKTFLLAPG